MSVDDPIGDDELDQDQDDEDFGGDAFGELPMPPPRAQGRSSVPAIADGDDLGTQAPATVKRAARILRAEKERQAVELRKAGATFEQIANTVGYSNASGASKAVKRALSRIQTEEPAELKVLMGEQLRQLLLSVWEAAIDKKHAQHLPALDRASNLIERIARLHGLDGVQGPVVQTNVQNNTILVRGDEGEFVGSLKRIAIERGTVPEGMGEVIEAEVLGE